ncbi:hypothetical protein Hanom_Chr17g01584101 [Helianthus anomalus]
MRSGNCFDLDGIWRVIRILDPMWFVNLSEKDIECLYFNKICYEVPEKTQAMQYQVVIRTCYAYEIHSGKMWDTNWREIERKEFLKAEKKEQRIADMVKKASIRRFQFINKPTPTNRTPIPSEERRTKPFRKYFFGR